MSVKTRVLCRSCGCGTKFEDDVAENDMITLVSGTPQTDAKYRCNVCGMDESKDTGFSGERVFEESTYE